MRDFDVALQELISEKLNENTDGVVFNVDLYNSTRRKYYTINDDNSKSRFVPTVITDISGEYLNIPDSDTTINTIGLNFEVYVGSDNKLSDEEVNEFSKVQYSETKRAIQEFKNSLLAKYFPLGISNLSFGGEDSISTILAPNNMEYSDVYIELDIKNTDEETLYNFVSTYPSLKKDATHLIYQLSVSDSIKIPYTIGEKSILIQSQFAGGSNYDYTINDGTNSDTDTFAIAPVSGSNKTITIGGTSGLEAILKRIMASSSKTSVVFDGTNIDEILINPQIDLNDFDTRYTTTNKGSFTNLVITFNNCILWGEDGNAIFGFDTLIPDSGLKTPEGYIYQSFFQNITCMVSNDVLFGNLFEYFLSTDDGVSYEQIIPVDRQHTYGTEVSSNQKINSKTAKNVINENMRDITNTFYYKASKKLNKLFKHIVSNTTSQNDTFKLKVQYPFFNEVYDVIVDSGGTSPNINAITSFTLTYKNKSDVL